MLDGGRIIPAYGLNLGTVGFLMNRHSGCAGLMKRIAKARPKWLARTFSYRICINRSNRRRFTTRW
jgi:hypothetical protein